MPPLSAAPSPTGPQPISSPDRRQALFHLVGLGLIATRELKRGTQTFLDEIESIDVALRDAPTSTHRQVKSFIMLSIARTSETNCFIAAE